jgi:hypothetical protein
MTPFIFRFAQQLPEPAATRLCADPDRDVLQDQAANRVGPLSGQGGPAPDTLQTRVRHETTDDN